MSGMTKYQMLRCIDEDALQETARMVGNSTMRYYLQGGGWAVQYHATTIIKWEKAESVLISHGGWTTRSTADRLNDHMPGYTFWRCKGEMWMGPGTSFTEAIPLHCLVLIDTTQPLWTQYPTYEAIAAKKTLVRERELLLNKAIRAITRKHRVSHCAELVKAALTWHKEDGREWKQGYSYRDFDSLDLYVTSVLTGYTKWLVDSVDEKLTDGLRALQDTFKQWRLNIK